MSKPIFGPRFTRISIAWLGLISLIAAIGCQPNTGIPVNVSAQPLQPTAADCSGRFIPHNLPHITADNVERIGFFISNGSGLAIQDLDLDGDQDIVLGNLLGPTQIFWNEGGLHFRVAPLFDGSVRAVTAVDINHDTLPDLIFTTRNGEVHLWTNLGEEQFERQRLNGVNDYAGFSYSANWADLDGDGDLDLVTGSYDASLEKLTSGIDFRERGFPGVHIYKQQEDGSFLPERLSDQAQALALEIADLNRDGRPDLIVGNDFDIPDDIWLNTTAGWEPSAPFEATTMSTMSFDQGDIDNDGRSEIFAADMHPYSDDPEIADQWEPVMQAMTMDVPEGDIQRMENVLHVSAGDNYVNLAESSGIVFTGWSWSSKFGDLNQDGLLDLYVVNGMQALDNFSHLENDELIEENQVYLNMNGQQFQSMPDWGLNSTRGGRSMSMADLDGDGDLDIVINNLGSPSVIFENRLCTGSALLVDLTWPESRNTQAIGAKVTLHLDGALQQIRHVTALSGYLSGNSSQIHFGIPEDSRVRQLIVTWPDGNISVINNVTADSQVAVERIR